MYHLSTQEIVKLQIDLLQSSGKTLTTLHKHLLVGSSEKMNKIFKQFDKAKLSHKMKKMFVANIQSMGDDHNTNLRVFSVVILKLIYSKQVNKDLLSLVKLFLHQQDTILTKITNIPKDGTYADLSKLSNSQMKKILVQFLHSLEQSFCQNIIQTQSKKYPLALQLLVVLFRITLFRFKVPQAQNYMKKISTTACYQILFEFLDVFYNKSENLYLLRDQNIFIQNGYYDENKQFVGQIVYGNYYQDQGLYQAAILKNVQSPLVKDRQSQKVPLVFTFGQFPMKNATAEKMRPFQLMMLENGPILSDSSHTNKSDRSLKGSNAFGGRNFNLSSNRSEVSANLQDSQCNNPTPSFNQVYEEDPHTLFSPSGQLLISNTYQRSRKAAITNNIMKRSATIMPVRNKSQQKANKPQQSSILEDLTNNIEQGSTELDKQTFQASDLKNKNDSLALDSTDSPISPATNFCTVQKVLQFSNRDRRQTTNVLAYSFQNIVLSEERRLMKRSQSQKNSFIKHLPDAQSEQGKIGLFEINCKKLKTSIQMDDTAYYSENKFCNYPRNDFNMQSFHDLCQHSGHSCSCKSLKSQRNILASNTIAFVYKPLDFDFKKKKVQFSTLQQGSSLRSPNTKSKLDDDFFKRIKAKRQQMGQQSTKNKRQHRSIQQKKNTNDRTFIKYSQIVKVQDKNLSKQKLQYKSEKVVKVIGSSFKKFQSFLTQKQIYRPTLEKTSPNNESTLKINNTLPNKSLTPTKVNRLTSPVNKHIKEPKEAVQFNYKHERNYFPQRINTKSITPSNNITGHNRAGLLGSKNIGNISIENILEFSITKSPKISSSPFSVHTEFGKNNHLYYNPFANKRT